MNNFPPCMKAYTPVAFCGGGAYGSVFLVRDSAGRRRALKIVNKTPDDGAWERELRGLENRRTLAAGHPNLVRIFHLEDCGDFFYCVMESADDLGGQSGFLPATLGNVLEKHGRLEAEKLRDVFASLLNGLIRLHRAGVVHRDIKPDNILFVGGVPKFGDFSLFDRAAQAQELAGTREFLPPEHHGSRAGKSAFGPDLYALGKTLYCAFTGKSVSEFPLVAPELLKDPGNRAINRLIRTVCAADPARRTKSAEEFRRALRESNFSACLKR